MDIKQVKEKLEWLEGYAGKTFRESYLLDYIASEGEEREKIEHEIQSLLEVKRNLQLFSDHPISRAPTSEKATDGKISIGTVVNAGKELYAWRVEEDFFINHVVQVAAPAHGKSVHLASVKEELLKNGISWVSIDSKNDYAGLVRPHPEILCVDAHRDLRFNIFEPPTGVDARVWWNLAADGIMHVCGFGHGVKAYIMRAVDQLAEERQGDFHLGHVLELIRTWSESSRTGGDYREVALGRLKLFEENKQAFWTKKSMPFEKIKWLIIRTHMVSPEVHSLIFEILLLRQFTYRLVNGIKDENAELCVIFVDEASKTSLARAKEHDWTAREIGTPTITRLLTTARQFKLSIWASDQLYYGLSDALKSVASTKIIGRLNSGQDIEDITKDASLEDEEMKVIRKLEVGHWIVRTAKISKPFVISTPDFKIPKITEEEIQLHMQDKRFWLEEEKQIDKVKRSVPSALSYEEWRLLSHVCAHPFMQLTNRLEENSGKGRLWLAKQGLVEKGLAVEKSVKIGRGAPRRLLDLTNEGINLLASVGHDVRFWRHIKNETIEHCFYKYLISDSLRQLGFETVKEKRIDVVDGYRIVDVFYQENGRRVGVEIECSTADIESKLRALEKLDVIVLATSSEENLRRMQEWLARNGDGLRQKTRVVSVVTYYGELQYLIRQSESRRNSDSQTKPDSASDGTKGGRK